MEREQHLKFSIACYQLAIQCYGVIFRLQWVLDEKRKARRFKIKGGRIVKAAS